MVPLGTDVPKFDLHANMPWRVYHAHSRYQPAMVPYQAELLFNGVAITTETPDVRAAVRLCCRSRAVCHLQRFFRRFFLATPKCPKSGIIAG